MKAQVDNLKQTKLIYVLVAISFISGLVLYYRFIFGDNILAYASWGSDTKQSYLPAYEFWHNWITSGRHSIYDFSFGWGSNIFVILWALIDPFTIIPILISTFAGVTWIGKTLAVFQILKSVTISLFGFKYFVQLGYSEKSAFIPAYILGYCGYMIVTGEHYFFATYAVFFMIILYYVEKSMQERKLYVQIAIGIGYLAAISAYAIFQTALIIGIYVLIRSYMLSATWREYVNGVFRILIGAVIGILLGAAGFVAQAYEILVVSNRISSQTDWGAQIKALFQLLPSGLIKESFYNIFSSDLSGTINNYYGVGGARFYTTPYFFSTIFSFALLYFIYKTIFQKCDMKEKKVRIIGLLFMGIILFLRFMPLITNLWVYVQWRYVFTIIPFSGLLVADYLEDLFNGKKMKWFLICLPIVACFVIAQTVDYQYRSTQIGSINMMVTTTGLAILFIVVQQWKKVRSQIVQWGVFFAVLAVIGCNIILDDAVIVYIDQIMMTKEELATGYHDARIENILNEVNSKEQDNFYRMDRTYLEGVTPDIMLSFLNPMRSLSVYDSMINGNLVNAITGLADTTMGIQEGYNIHTCGMQYDQVLSDIYGLKYVFSNTPRLLKGWNKIQEIDGLFVYQNENLNSAGLIFNQIISESVYQGLSAVEKQFAVGDYLILPDEVCRNQDAVKIQVEEDINTIFSVENKEDGDRINLNIQRNIKDDTDSVLNITVENPSDQIVMCQFYNDMDYMLYSKQFTLSSLVAEQENAMKIPQDASYATITYARTDTQILQYQVYTHNGVGYSNNGIQLKNPSFGGTIQGAVEVQEDAYLFLPIPYEKYWNIEVNGEPVQYEKAHFGFMMIQVEKGTNMITMCYRNKVNYVSIFISVCTAIGLVIFSVIRRRRKF